MECPFKRMGGWAGKSVQQYTETRIQCFARAEQSPATHAARKGVLGVVVGSYRKRTHVGELNILRCA